MFLVTGETWPADPEGLARALQGGIGEGLAPGGAPPRVRAEGASAEALDRLEIGLDGAVLDPAKRPRPCGTPEPGPVAESFLLSGRGLRVGSVALDLSIRAEGARFERGRDAAGRLLLVPSGARGGRADLFVPREGLESALAAGIRATGARGGIDVEDVVLELEPEPPAVRARLLVTVKKVFSARIRVSARIEAGKGAALAVRDVSCRGEGMTGSLVAKLARPQVEALDGREFPLGAFLPPGLSPRDGVLSCDGGLRLRVRLGDGD